MRSITSLLEMFWEAIWTRRKLLLGSSTPMYLVYYIVDIEQIDEGDARVFLSLLVHDYGLLRYEFGIYMTSAFAAMISQSFNSNSSYAEQPSRDAYMVLCRVMVFLWLNPAIEKSEPQPETWTTILGMVSLFAGGKYAGLTLDDLKTFVERDILPEYGAKLFLTNLSHAMRAPSAHSKDRTRGEDVRDMLFAIDTMAVRAECKPYFVSSGLLQAIREVFDDPLLRTLSSDRQWLVYRDAIEILECVHQVCFVCTDDPYSYSSSGIIALAPTGKAAQALLRGHNVFGLISQSISVYGDTRESHADSE